MKELFDFLEKEQKQVEKYLKTHNTTYKEVLKQENSAEFEAGRLSLIKELKRKSKELSYLNDSERELLESIFNSASKEITDFFDEQEFNNLRQKVLRILT